MPRSKGPRLTRTRVSAPAGAPRLHSHKQIPHPLILATRNPCFSDLLNQARNPDLIKQIILIRFRKIYNSRAARNPSCTASITLRGLMASPTLRTGSPLFSNSADSPSTDLEPNASTTESQARLWV